MEQTTIAAIATPPGRGGIGIIRISGPDSYAIAGSIFKSARNSRIAKDPNKTYPVFSGESHKFYYGFILDPEQNRIIDEVLFVYMRAPFSYTREDIVEIHSHSNEFVLRDILDLLIKKGALLAEPGEFTRRAFLNGRIDLTQAEAVAEIIQAKSSIAARLAVAQVQGGLRQSVQDLKQKLSAIQVPIEASIDFPEEVEGEISSRPALLDSIDHTVDSIQNLIELYQQGTYIRSGIKIAIIGAPNVGKSSLMNRLVQTDRSIVTSIPGTTRDLIEDTFFIDGIPISIIDTAGIHISQDPVEKIGIDRAIQCAHTADLILFVLEAGRDLSSHEEMTLHKLKDVRKCLVINKTDLFENQPGRIQPKNLINFPAIQISALKNKGIDHLKSFIASICINDKIAFSAVIPNLRQKNLLIQCAEACMSAKKAIIESMPEEIISIDIQEAIHCLHVILGEATTEDVLDGIFSSFCIGK